MSDDNAANWDSVDLSEMEIVTVEAKHAGFKQVTADPDHVIALIAGVKEAVRLRAELAVLREALMDASDRLCVRSEKYGPGDALYELVGAAIAQPNVRAANLLKLAQAAIELKAIHDDGRSSFDNELNAKRRLYAAVAVYLGAGGGDHE